MSRHRLFNSRILLPLVAALLLVVAVACGSSATATPVPAAASSTPAPAGNTPVPAVVPATDVPAASGAKYGGDVRMSAYADTKDWDPLGSGSLSSVQAYSQLYNQLVQFDSVDTTLIEGDLATSWEVSNGGQTFIFHLAENARWQDGEDLTADDVVFAFSR